MDNNSKGALNNLSDKFCLKSLVIKMPVKCNDSYIVSIRHKANEAVLKTYESSKETKSSSGTNQ